MAGLIVIGVVFFALMELQKNSLWGWALGLAALMGFFFLRREVLADRPWLLRAAGWAALLAVLAVIFTCTKGPFLLRKAVEGKAPAVTEIVTVAQGQLTGVTTADGAVEVYAGIPYAKPPVGELRWKEPQDPEAWDGVLAADHFAPMSMQPSNGALYNSLADIVGYHDYRITVKDNFRDVMSEDSLYLNIWKPAGAVSGAPVLVYVHGGSLMTGQPWYADYSGEGLARDGVIVVNMGYRLGVFGFFADPELAAESPNGTTGNYGLLDQIKALEWVRDNIAAFGGDADNVTLAGESAGSACVSALCTSPRAAGLFRRVIGESSTTTAPRPAHSYRTLEEAYQASAKTRQQLGGVTLAQLRDMSAEELVKFTDDHHHITVDGYVLTESPWESYRKGIHNEEAVLHGFNASESALFTIFDNATLKNYESKVRGYFGDYADAVLALYPAATDAEAKENWRSLFSAVYFSYGHYCWTRQAIACGEPVYEYYFTKSNGRLGANHGGEEVYFYGNIPAGDRHYDESDRALGALMHEHFRSFIATGEPGGDWAPAADASSVYRLGEAVGTTQDPYRPLYDILDEMQGWEASEHAQ
ncbi:MAG: carboxylesterase family protein [Oscillospiraceae bacterium]|nr:carboxylesterase family protein [Oscillospiraceae bacterium]